MAVDQTLLDELTDRLSPLGDFTQKRMFGGVGLFAEGKMFAMMTAKGAVAFKADAESVEHFTALNMEKFGRMPYYILTADQLEDDEAILSLGALALAAARRAS